MSSLSVKKKIMGQDNVSSNRYDKMVIVRMRFSKL